MYTETFYTEETAPTIYKKNMANIFRRFINHGMYKIEGQIYRARPQTFKNSKFKFMLRWLPCNLCNYFKIVFGDTSS